MTPADLVLLAAIFAWGLLAAPGSIRRAPSRARHRAPGPATTHLTIPMISFHRGAGPIWWLYLNLPVSLEGMA